MRLYRDLAEDYFALEAKRRDVSGDLIQLSATLRQSGARSVVDLGCGTGEHVAALCKIGFDARGIDRARAMISVGQKRFPQIAGRLSVQNWQNYNGPRCDAALCLFGSFGYHLSQRSVRRGFVALRRSLKPGGVAIVEVWNAVPLEVVGSQPMRPAASLSGRLERSRSARIVRQDPTIVRLDYHYDRPQGTLRDRQWLRAFSPESLAELCAGSGLKLSGVARDFSGEGFASDAHKSIRLVAFLRAL